MRYPASEKLEIIRTVEGSHLPTKKTLDMLGIPRTTFCRWYDRYVEGGLDALSDRSPHPKSVWNRIPQDRRDDLIEFALEHEALTTRELAVKYTDEKRYGPVTLLFRPKCSFKPPSVRKRPGFSSLVLSVGGADCRSR